MKLIFFVCFSVLLFSGTALATGDDNQPLIYKTVFGVLAHDRGPTSDEHEDGIDPNWEVQFNPPGWKALEKIGSPYPTIGITPNFNGDTSALYGALTYESGSFANKLFLAGSLGIALHDGPLKKDRYGCDNDSDCGFGWRALPRFSGELGYKVRDNHGISLYYDHMSHRHILPGENEGIDHIGFRYFYAFKQSDM